MRILGRLLLLVLPAFVTTTLAQDGGDLPDIGSPYDSVFTKAQERQIGRTIVKQLRDEDQIVIDPEVSEYIQDLGQRLSAFANSGEHKFTFFVVKDNAINAFALPGGYIGVNSGLIQATKAESELAGVLAHEIAHVTQKHIERQVQATGKASLLSAAAILAAILVTAATDAGGDAAMAAVAASQGAAIQHSINFTRANEYEADRIGVGILSEAGFDPEGMPDFFETMGRRTGLAAYRVPEFLQTHPVSSARIAETRSRARQLPAVDVEDGQSYSLIRERLRVLGSASAADALEYYQKLGEDPDVDDADPGYMYGLGIAHLSYGNATQAIKIFEALLYSNEGVIPYHIALGQAYLRAGRNEDALAVYRGAQSLFPRNVPLTIRYSEALLRSGEAKEAHEVLLDLLNNIRPTPEQAWLIALAARAAGDNADAHYYLSEFHILNGELPMAVHQLQLALATPGIENVQRARFQARMDEIKEYIPKPKRKPVLEEREPRDQKAGR